MKKPRLLYLLLLLVCFSSCKKFVQQQQQNALENVITDGVWLVTKYIENGTDISPAFNGYAFRFSNNGTVTGTKIDTVVNGTWSGSIADKTITSNFPTAGSPVNKLNSVWDIVDSYTDSVSATTTINSSFNRLQLKKQ